MAFGRQNVSGVRAPSELAAAILARIRGRDLPAGACLDPVRLAPVMAADKDRISDALRQLEQAGVAVSAGQVWKVRADRPVHPREILSRGKPALLAVARLAALHATPAQAAGISAARDRIGGIAGDGSPETRAAAYREMIERVARASNSLFHIKTLRQMLDETADLFVPIAARDMEMHPEPNPEGELVRLADAISAGDPDAAEAAMKDHLLLLACHMTALSPT